jgi:hypothetical protein
MQLLSALSQITKLIPGYRWTIVDDNKAGQFFLRAIASFDSFLGWKYDKSHDVSEYPLENGSFRSYNKVLKPFTATAILVKSGLNLPFQKKAFLDKLEEYCNTTKLVCVITPQGVYRSLTITGISTNNDSSNNPGMVVANVSLKEIQTQLSISSGMINPSDSNLLSSSNRGILQLGIN